jgi:hypothetical protein
VWSPSVRYPGPPPARHGFRWVVAALVACLLSVQAYSATGPSSPTPANRAAFPSIVLGTQDPAAAGYGFAVVDSTPSQLQDLPAGMHSLVWLGGYDNATCTFATSDAHVRSEFARYGLAADARVFGYFLADEPNTNGNCPGASDQVRQRATLVRSVDPNPRHVTLANIDDPSQFAAFRDSVDVLSTDPYPCAEGAGCDWSMIPAYVDALRHAGVSHYMGTLQAFSGGGWRWPTAGELQQMVDQWRRSDWCGAITFSWSYQGGRLADHPDLVAVLRQFNARPPVPAAPCS